MAQAAKLGARDFVRASVTFECFLGGSEMDRDFHSWNRVLLQPEFTHEKGVCDVFGAQDKLNWPAYGDGQRCCNDVIP